MVTLMELMAIRVTNYLIIIFVKAISSIRNGFSHFWPFLVSDVGVFEFK